MKSLLVLDIDETLIHCEEFPKDYFEEGEYHFKIDFGEDDPKAYFGNERPFLKEFLDYAFKNFDVAIWTASTEDYATIVLESIGVDINKLVFFYTRENCGMRLDYETGHYYGIKNLSKLRKKGTIKRKYGRELDRVLIVDDIEKTAINNFGNLIQIEPFIYNSNDVELLKLISYLEKIKNEPNYRSINKRGWNQSNETFR